MSRFQRHDSSSFDEIIMEDADPEATIDRRPVSFNFVNLFIGGQHFKTHKETLERYPDTLLGSQRKDQYWDSERDAYVFTDHCRRSFESILYFYQSNGTLSQPRNVYFNTFMEEVDFFELPRGSLRTVNTQSRTKRTISSKGSESWSYKYMDNNHQKIAYPPSNVRYTKLYSMLYGRETWTYKVIMACDLFATVTFVFCHVVSTVNVKKGTADEMNAVIPEDYIRGIEAACMLWIIIHYLAGIIVAAERFKYFTSFMPMVDAIIVVAVLLDNILIWNNLDEALSQIIPLPLRAIGVLRLFNLARHSTLLYCLGLALRQSFSDLMHVLSVIIFIIFLAAGFAYFIEGPKCGQYINGQCLYEEGPDVECKFYRECTNYTTKFTNVFISSYWAAVTITTVGYGDMVPQTALGKIVGSILALIGLPLIAIPMPLIMTKFEKLYNTVKEHQREEANSKDNAPLQRRHFKFNGKSLKKTVNNEKIVYTRAHDIEDVSMRPIDVPQLDEPATLKENQHEIEESKTEDEAIANGQKTWSDNYVRVYGRCPTGTCNQSNCITCSEKDPMATISY